MKFLSFLAASSVTGIVLTGCLPEVREDGGAPATAEAERREYTDPVVPKDPEGFKKTDSGLMYKIVRPGGEKHPGPTDVVLCHYKGELEDGTVFDSSYKRGAPIDFPLNGVISGWTEGLQLIGEGGRVDLIIPSDLGYGAGGMPAGGIPGGATLHFVVELVEIM